MENQKEKEKRAKILALLAVKPFVRDIIAFLMNEGDYSQNQKKIADEIKIFPNILQMDIGKMVALGILIESPIGREKYYKIDKSRAFVLLELIHALEIANEAFGRNKF